MTELRFDAETEEFLDLALDLVNDTHGDSMAMVCRWVEADDTIESGRLLGIDPYGLDAEVDGADGTRAIRSDWDEPITDLHGLEAALVGMVEKARHARPTDPPTNLELRMESAHRQVTHACEVLEVSDLGPRLRRIVFGPLPAWDDQGGDQAMTIFLDLPGRPVPDNVTLSELQALDDDVRPKGATYSIRRWDPDDRTVEVWLVRHGDDPETVSGWAGVAAIGDKATLFGPRRGSDAPEGTARFYGVCDETGLAATMAILDELPSDVPADLLVEVGGDAAFDLTDRPATSVHWVDRGDAEPGTGTALIDRSREVVRADEGVFVFGAGESRLVTAVRKHVRNELGVAARQVSLTGYWRRT
ncbi:MAG: SIP domain-containing protein [Actinomycetota bacterium]